MMHETTRTGRNEIFLLSLPDQSPQESRRAACSQNITQIFVYKAVVRDLGKTKSAKQKAAKEARKIVEMKGKQIKDELSLAMIQLFTKIDDAIRGSD